VAVAKDGQAPSLVLDAGTGLHNLSKVLDGRPFRGTILVGHLHWDHTHGLPFFSAGDRPDSRVAVMIPAQGDPREVMARAMSPPHFPVRIDELQGDWRVDGLEEGDHLIEEFRVRALEIPHKGGRTFGYRISDGTAAIAYLSDHYPFSLGPGPGGYGEYHQTALTLCEGADLMIHDAQYTGEEFPRRAAFGHSSIDYAVGLAEVSGVKKLVLFHHDPRRTDDELDEILGSLEGRKVPIEAAAEGAIYQLPE
jgi:ribonuclease BN (tRNA processing enzyme)